MATLSPSSQRAAIHQLAVKDLFDSLTQREKLYAHYLSQAAWHGSRIILRQTSSEGTGIFDFILELHKACGGQWNKLIDQCGVTPEELDTFLDFSGLFLSNMGNYFASNSCYTSPHHLLTVYRGREIGRLSRTSLLMLCAELQAYRRRQPLPWRRSST